MDLSYARGARGFVVVHLQEKLGISADGIFGAQTTGAVKALQAERQMEVTGRAGPEVFREMGASWPDDFERAINLVCNFEGTSFGDCNIRDIDGAGLTYGIAGFTTAHGEVQALLGEYALSRPSAFDILPGDLRKKVNRMLAGTATRRQWRDLFYGDDGAVISGWRRAFAAWGRCPVMQMLQMDLARHRFWKPAVETAKSLGFKSLQARCFFLDVAVQNGGWRQSHLLLSKRMLDWHSDDEDKALAAAARAVAACAKEQWRNDVLSRKMMIATGAGVVHGRQWRLADHALMAGD